MKKKTNNKILALMSLLLFLPLFVGCFSTPATNESPTIITSISVLPSSMTIKKGQSQTIDSITAYYNNSLSANIELSACTYQSNITDVTATNGVIKIPSICAATSAIITVSYTDSGVTKSDTVNVTITCGCGG